MWLNLPPRAHVLFGRLFSVRGQASRVEVTVKAAAVVQEDHCPSLRSFYFIVRRLGLGNAFPQTCYVTAVTGTDVDLSSV